MDERLVGSSPNGASRMEVAYFAQFHPELALGNFMRTN